LNKLTEYSVINCRIIFPDTIPVFELNNQQRRNILLVTKEIVHNAIKHSGGKTLSVTAVIQKKQLLFDVADDGIGFDTSSADKGNGLRNIRQRVSEIGGSIRIQSGPGEGTQFFYSFPLS
jgi:signal transduction histidine kinase